ncbi:hypothetical protein [Streptomyces sp. NPDC006638]|uniref:hypothetical protein n=1 Tax=unclassified Streptomyces TaxID=2593676 RepID=UPI0033A696F8
MSLHEELTAVKRSLDDLVRTVGQLERRLGETRAAEARPLAPALVHELIPIPDTPYNHALWTDSDDEGLGVHSRRT